MSDDIVGKNLLEQRREQMEYGINGIKHYAIKSCLIQIGEHLVGLLGTFGRNLIVQVDEKAVNINVRHDTIAPFSEEENSHNHYDEQQ